MKFLRILLVGCLAASGCLNAFAQPAGEAKKPQAENKAQAQNNEKEKAEPLHINAVTVTLLIKGAVFALHQANVTGNYSVLRDLGTPVFRERFDQAALTAAFSEFRSRQVDLSPILLLVPNLTKQPEIDGQGQLHLVGEFPTQPLKVHFELAFLQLDGNWRLAGIAVDAKPASEGVPQASLTPNGHTNGAPHIASGHDKKLGVTRPAGMPAGKPAR